MAKNGKSKSKKNRSKPAPKKRLTLVNMKVPQVELEVLRANAKRFSGGNLSLWLRTSGVYYRPNSR